MNPKPIKPNGMPSIVEWPIDKLHEYGNNPRKIPRKAVDAVAQSIVAYGSCVPIVATSDGEIVAGHVRFRAAKQLGLTTFPVIVADGLSAQQIKAYRIADNKIRCNCLFSQLAFSEAATIAIISPCRPLTPYSTGSQASKNDSKRWSLFVTKTNA